MPLSIHKQAVFLHIPKNAGTSIIEALDFRLGLPGHKTWRAYRKRAITQDGDRYFTFAFVRHPLSRLVSIYNYSIMGESYYHSRVGRPGAIGPHPDEHLSLGKSLGEVVQLLADSPDSFRHPGWSAQHPFVFDDDGTCMVDYLGRYEHLAEDLATVADRLDIDVSSLPHRNNSPQTTWQSCFDPETRELAESIFAQDLDALGYRLEGPDDQRRYLDSLTAACERVVTS